MEPKTRSSCSQDACTRMYPKQYIRNCYQMVSESTARQRLSNYSAGCGNIEGREVVCSYTSTL